MSLRTVEPVTRATEGSDGVVGPSRAAFRGISGDSRHQTEHGTGNDTGNEVGNEVGNETGNEALHDTSRGAGQTGPPVGRRIFLGLLGLGAVGVVTGKALQDGLSRAIAPVQTRDPTGLSGLLPLGSAFRYYSVTGSVPTRDDASYRLQVTGLVDRPMTLTMADLAGLPQSALTRDFQCVTGWRVPDVPWRGVKLADVLERAGVQSAATAVRFTSFDGTYTESLTLGQARRDDVLVATSMLGGPVTHNHGGPVRLYVAPMYGYKSLKWLGGIELTAAVRPGYWEENGYDVDGWVGRSNGRSDDPTG